MKAVGIKTDNNTKVVAYIGPETSFIARMVASLALSPSSKICLEAFSTTIIASSTTIPIARIKPKRVSIFIENPSADITAKVPINDTGIVIAGIIVFPLATYLLLPEIGGLLAVAVGSLLGRTARTVAAYLDLAVLTRREARC